MSGDWLQTLNPAQREAVTHGDGPLLIVAGAGTGKTRTLAARVAHLIEHGVAAERILLLTFTRRAAAEMLRRARSISGQAQAERVWGGTFHAVANRLLRMYGRSIGLSPESTVMDQADAADLMNLIRSELGLSGRERRFPRKQTLVSIYSRAVNAQQKLGDVLEAHYPWCAEHEKDIAAIFQRYAQRKRDNQVLDYDDLLLYWRALCEDERQGAKVGRRFEHILVDEYQDTNLLQAQILLALGRHCANIVVVGDDAQSIYSFRAATVRNILDFPQQFPGTRIVKLEQNYRSTQPILDACNAVMDEARERYTKNLWSKRQSGARPELLTCVEELEQCEVVCQRVLAHLEEGVPLHRQAVLFRAGFHSAALEIELARRKIPFHKYGGLRFVEAAHIKDVLALFRIFENPYDEMSWFRLLTMFDGVGPRTAQRIMEHLGVRRPPAEAAGHEARSAQSPLRRLLDDPPSVPPSAQETFDALRRLIADCCAPAKDKNNHGSAPDRSRGPSIAVQVERVRRFYEPLAEQKFDNWVVRLRDLEQLEQIAARYRSRARFLTDLTLDPPSSTADLAGPPFLEEDFLVLSTIHSAKGLEWDAVHVIHAADGMIPSDMALTSEEELEEERRLFYVALTRARDRLYVYFPLRYYRRPAGMSDRHIYAQLTRFLSPAVRQHFEHRPARTSAEDQPAAAAGVVEQVHTRLNDLWA